MPKRVKTVREFFVKAKSRTYDAFARIAHFVDAFINSNLELTEAQLGSQFGDDAIQLDKGKNIPNKKDKMKRRGLTFKKRINMDLKKAIKLGIVLKEGDVIYKTVPLLIADLENPPDIETLTGKEAAEGKIFRQMPMLTPDAKQRILNEFKKTVDKGVERIMKDIGGIRVR